MRKFILFFILFLSFYSFSNDLKQILYNQAENLENSLLNDLLVDISTKMLTNYKNSKEKISFDSSLQGKRCPFYPSCSIYTKQAIKKYGFFIGLIIGWDRLYYRHNEKVFDYYDFFIEQGRVYAYDPIYDPTKKEENFFSPFIDDGSIPLEHFYHSLR